MLNSEIWDPLAKISQRGNNLNKDDKNERTGDTKLKVVHLSLNAEEIHVINIRYSWVRSPSHSLSNGVIR